MLTRSAYAHEAVITMQPEGDVRAPGAAITVALCGHWNHEPPCPIAPHHTQVARTGNEVRIRTLFAVEPGAEQLVRQRIDHALSRGELQGPDSVITRWQVVTTESSEVTVEERDHAARLIGS